ncbi:16S rRNA (uracil(1498)-N(3))-methyltransferase [Gudongella sp. DL1XJH-153]|uniref:16S rRNA (uracil(1498)-N(3))-methyltransferase n=1 Tax=Gudongella sp. DL1XJH-153 TaxID=3409804 RepID=UPI003BB5AFA1
MMHRFFTENSIDDNDKLEINGGDVKHIRDVLRILPGEHIEIVTGNKAYVCNIMEISKSAIITEILNPIEKSHESPVKINLFQGLPKSSKMETILQKCTEIGVASFYPLVTNRTVVKLKDDKKENRKIERWEAIVHEASKQSKRDRIPVVNPVIDFRELVVYLKEGITIVPYEASTDKGIKDVLKSLKISDTVNIIIGPEGGFEEEEIKKLVGLGAKIVSLGPRILRTETAGMVASSIVQYEYGDLGVI